jgi:hypothetical protein
MSTCIPPQGKQHPAQTGQVERQLACSHVQYNAGRQLQSIQYMRPCRGSCLSGTHHGMVRLT